MVSNSGIKKPTWSKISNFRSTYHYKETPPKTGDVGCKDSSYISSQRKKRRSPMKPKSPCCCQRSVPRPWSDPIISNGAKAKTIKKFDDVKAKFENELAGRKRIVFSRYQFWEYSKTVGQTFDEFLTQLRTLALSCEFTETDNMIRDKIVFSTEDPALKERLLRETKLDLQKAVDISRSSELAHKEFVTMKSTEKSTQLK